VPADRDRNRVGAEGHEGQDSERQERRCEHVRTVGGPPGGTAAGGPIAKVARHT
jgi:hypothetical protein